MAGRAGDCFEKRFRAEGSCRRVTDLHGRAGDARVSARGQERSSLLPCFPRRRRMSGIGLRAVGRDTPGKSGIEPSKIVEPTIRDCSVSSVLRNACARRSSCALISDSPALLQPLPNHFQGEFPVTFGDGPLYLPAPISW